MPEDVAPNEPARARFDPAAFTRPDPALLRYYTLVAAATVVAFPFVWLPYFFRYQTLRYAFDDEGVSVSVGLLFKKEVVLTYRRIQDIHVKRGLLQRWVGISTVAVQTASGASGAEMTIEGVRDPEALRDFLYARMRGAKDEHEHEVEDGTAVAAPADEALALLREIRDLLKADAGGTVHT
jgi:putative membrane protein